MDQRNPTCRDLLNHAFPVRLEVAVPHGHADPVDCALRRVLGRDALRGLVGDMGYALKRAGHHRGGARAVRCAARDVDLYGRSDRGLRGG